MQPREVTLLTHTPPVCHPARFFKKQGPTRHRPMAHLVVFRYLSYSTMLAEHAIHRLRRCLAFDRAGTSLFSAVQSDDQWVSHPPTEWPLDHGPTNVLRNMTLKLKFLMGCLYVVLKTTFIITSEVTLVTFKTGRSIHRLSFRSYILFVYLSFVK